MDSKDSQSINRQHKPHRIFWTWVTFVSTLGLIALSGCGDGRPELIPVAGKVFIDGKPVEHGFIRVHPDGYRAASGELGPGGRFRLTTYELNDGCVAGNHPVTVNALEVINARSQRWHAPKKYRDAETSGLMIEISEPTDAVEIQLNWAGGKPFIETNRGGE
jgi:hypothetical protein